jgi:hypothetical protein
LERIIDGTKPENKPRPVGYQKANQRRRENKTRNNPAKSRLAA